MKRLFLLLIPTFLIYSCGSSENSELVPEIDSTYCQCNELELDEPYNHYYRFDRKDGFTGLCEDFYPSGELKMSRNLVNGKIHGFQEKYFDNGQLAETREFDMNFQVGAQLNFSREGDTVFHALYNRGKQTEVIKITQHYEKVK